MSDDSLPEEIDTCHGCFYTARTPCAQLFLFSQGDTCHRWFYIKGHTHTHTCVNCSVMNIHSDEHSQSCVQGFDKAMQIQKQFQSWFYLALFRIVHIENYYIEKLFVQDTGLNHTGVCKCKRSRFAQMCEFVRLKCKLDLAFLVNCKQVTVCQWYWIRLLC